MLKNRQKKALMCVKNKIETKQKRLILRFIHLQKFTIKFL